MKTKHIGILMGGSSAERAISLRSGEAVLHALQQYGLNVTGIDLNANDERQWSTQISQQKLDIALILLHGSYGEDGCIQGLLESMRLPYSGSGVLASALCMDKKRCKIILQDAGLSVPYDLSLRDTGPLRYPAIIKPIAEGSSIGLHHVQTEQDWLHLKLENLQQWMAEMPVRGVELAVSVINGEALLPIEVSPHSGLYDFTSKYTLGASDYYCPARLPAETLRYCMQCAETAVQAADCRGMPRVDMIVADGGEAVILEINTIPGMTATSLLPKAAAYSGIDFTELCLQMIDTASLDHRV